MNISNNHRRFLKSVFRTAAVLVLANSVRSYADTRPNPIEIELDPIAFALKGYSFHLGVPHKYVKIDFGTAHSQLNAKQTKTLLGNDGFESKFTSYGVKVDWLVGGLTGFHLGLQWDASRWTYTSTATRTSVDHNLQTLGPRVGYRFGSDTFYINPWVAFLWTTRGSSDVDVGAESFKPKRLQIFPTVHLGLRF